MMVLSLYKGLLHQPTSRPSMASIAAEVAERYGVTVDDLKGESRRRKHAHPRQEAFYLCRQVVHAPGFPRFSLPQIGAFFGDRDHTTVLHGVRVHADRLTRAERLAA